MEEERLYDIGSIELTDLIEQRRMSLGDKNEDYKKLSKEFKKIMDMYPNLQLILEKDRDVMLNEVDCKMLQKLVSVYLEMTMYEEREIFFLGGKEAYYYFKNMGILKE